MDSKAKSQLQLNFKPSMNISFPVSSPKRVPLTQKVSNASSQKNLEKIVPTAMRNSSLLDDPNMPHKGMMSLLKSLRTQSRRKLGNEIRIQFVL